jgi:hypothetical protein
MNETKVGPITKALFSKWTEADEMAHRIDKRKTVSKCAGSWIGAIAGLYLLLSSPNSSEIGSWMLVAAPWAFGYVAGNVFEILASIKTGR